MENHAPQVSAPPPKPKSIVFSVLLAIAVTALIVGGGTYVWYKTEVNRLANASLRVDAELRDQLKAVKERAAAMEKKAEEAPPAVKLFEAPLAGVTIIEADVAHLGELEGLADPVSKRTYFIPLRTLARLYANGERVNGGAVRHPLNGEIVFFGTDMTNAIMPSPDAGDHTNGIYAYNLKTGALTDIYRETKPYDNGNPGIWALLGIDGSKLIVWKTLPGRVLPRGWIS